MADVNAVLAGLSERFDPVKAEGVNEVFQFDIADTGSYYLSIAGGQCNFAEGEHDDPSVTLALDGDTLKGLLDGSVNGMQAFMFGKIKATGNIALAAKLTSYFGL